MRLGDILESYPDTALDRLASDKVDQVSNLRLPRAVLIEEVAAALSSYSYVHEALAPARPPTYAFLKLLLEAPDHRVPVKRVLRASCWAVRSRCAPITRRSASSSGKMPSG